MSRPPETDALAEYEIGAKLRALRLKKKLGLVELASHTGLSPGMLSKLERGRLVPTLPTLMRIATVFSVDLEYFFAERRRRRVLAVVRSTDRQRFPDTPGSSAPAYTFESLNFPVNEPRCLAYLAEFSGTASKVHEHAGVEMIYVLTGKLAIDIEGQEQVLGRGDAIYFDAAAPHAYRRVGASTCTALVFAVP